MLNQRDYRFSSLLKFLRNDQILRKCDRLELWFVEEEYG